MGLAVKRQEKVDRRRIHNATAADLNRRSLSSLLELDQTAASEVMEVDDGEGDDDVEGEEDEEGEDDVDNRGSVIDKPNVPKISLEFVSLGPCMRPLLLEVHDSFLGSPA
jgi:hypothetical protein